VAVLSLRLRYWQTSFASSLSDDYSGSVRINAIIEPVRYVILNNSNKIIEILSNTNSNVKPLVYLNSTNGAKLTLSKSIYAKYEKIVESIKTNSKYGVIYKYNPKKNENIKILSVIKFVHLDFQKLIIK
jgi:hypothetical protein